MCDLCSQIGLNNSDFTLHDVKFQHIRLSSDFQSYPRKWHCHLESSTICHVYPSYDSYPQQDCFHYGFYQFKSLHQFRIPCTPLHVQPALQKLDLNPIHPHFTSIPFHPESTINPTPRRSLHWSAEFLQRLPRPHLFARLASLCPAPGCFTGWCVRCVHGIEIVWVEISWVLKILKGSIFSDFNWLLFTWSKQGNQSLRAAAI